jgi:acid phosphatase type 7
MTLSFFRPRPSGASLARPSLATAAPTSLAEAPERNGFEPIPFPPAGPLPYRLDLMEILGVEAVDRIRAAKSMTFHTIGDSGGVKSPEAQANVSRGLERSFVANPKPASFLYHVGDVVYYMGETNRYFDQFYEPYEHYPAPIFAIPGNHDGATGSSGARSLEGFQRNFCASKGVYTKESMDTQRMAMIQPYVYWCLDTPLAYFIGLYTNVPEGGLIDTEQRNWFCRQLTEAPTDRALILALHHPIYSFDDFHSGSPVMAKEVQDAINASRRAPNLILTAHVHNYQRIEKQVGARTLPLLVIGNGGYWNLHGLTVAPGHQDANTNARLVAGCDYRHGFTTIEVTHNRIDGFFTTVPRPQESWSEAAGYRTFDTFSYPALPIRLDDGESIELLYPSV